MRVEEFDDAGKLRGTYIASKAGDKTRIDVIRPANQKRAWEKILDAFLPAGYPSSVTDDYLQYQIYDSLQAFASSIAGMLSSRAALEGVGVGDSTTSPQTALLHTTLRETLSRLATILFAHRVSKALSPESKRYRLLADILNDLAMLLDLLSPLLPRGTRVGVLAASGIARALCGVAAGATKSHFSAHFASAPGGDLGDLSAKDGSQETVVSLAGMLVGSVVVSVVTGGVATWVCLVVLLGAHLWCNLLAVRSVRLRSLNRQRAGIVVAHVDGGGFVLTPSEVAARERVFESDGIVKGKDGRQLGWIVVGARWEVLVGRLGRSHDSTKSTKMPDQALESLVGIFSQEEYLLWHDTATTTVYIVFKQACTAQEQFKAWWQGYILLSKAGQTSAKTLPKPELRKRQVGSEDERYSKLKASLEEVNQSFERIAPLIEAAGWQLSLSALETQPSSRISIKDDQ